MSLAAAGMWVAGSVALLFIREKVKHPHKNIERDLEVAMEAAGLLPYNSAKIAVMWSIVSTKKMHYGYDIILKPPGNKTLNDLQKAADLLSISLDADLQIQANKKGLIKVTIYENPLPTMIPFDESLLSACRNTWKFPIGKDREGWTFWDTQKTPHLLFAGLTNTGKSVFARGIVSMAILNHPEEVEVWIIDGKACGDYNELIGLPQVRDVRYTETDAIDILRKVNADLDKRSGKLRDDHCDNINDYNDLHPQDPMKRTFVLVDEMAQLRETESQALMARIAQLGRAVGIHLICGTQRPDAKVVNPMIKAMCDAVVCFRVRNSTNSEIILDESGAEKLPAIQGRCIFQTDTSRILQSPYASQLRLRWLFMRYGIRGGKSAAAFTENLSNAGNPLTEGELKLIIEKYEKDKEDHKDEQGKEGGRKRPGTKPDDPGDDVH